MSYYTQYYGAENDMNQQTGYSSSRNTSENTTATPRGGLHFLPSQYDLPPSTTSAWTTSQDSTNLETSSSFSSSTSLPSLRSASATPAPASSSSTYSYTPTNSKKQPPLSQGLLAAFGTSGYPGEPPLLEELGVNFLHIRQKTWAVLNPFKSSQASPATTPKAPTDPSSSSTDMAGPILFCLLLGTFLLMSGKLHFGYIYTVALIGTVVLYFTLNLMTPSSPLPSPSSSGFTIGFSTVASILGYSMLPLVFTSAIGVFLRMDTIPGYVVAAFSIAWCTYSASASFVAVIGNEEIKDNNTTGGSTINTSDNGGLSEIRLLVAYPLALFYGVFSVLTVFASTV